MSALAMGLLKKGCSVSGSDLVKNDETNKLEKLGVDSNRILLITAICSNKGLNEIAKLFPNQVIYTSCIDEEDEKTKLLVPGIGNSLSRLSTIFQDKN